MRLFTPPLGDIKVLSIGIRARFTSKLNRREETMSTSYEVPIEPLVSDGSNYAFWSINVQNHLRNLGPLAERVVVASILPPNFSWKNVDITNKREMDCMQLNALVTDYLMSVVCAEISDIILEDEEMRENAYLIWKFLKNLYDKNCSVSSVTSTAHQESSVKSQEDKDSKGIDSTPKISANPEVPDWRIMLKYINQMMNQPLIVLLNHIIVIISALWPQLKTIQIQILIVVVIMIVMMMMRS